MNDQTTIKRQPADKYLKQVAKVVNKKLTDKEKAELLFRLLPPDDTSVNAELVHFLVRSLKSPQGAVKDDNHQALREMTYMSRLLEIGIAAEEYLGGENYQVCYVWTAHYEKGNAADGSKTIERKFTKTLDRTPNSEQLNNMHKKALARFPKAVDKNRGRLDGVDYEVCVLDSTNRPVLVTTEQPVKLK